MPLRFDAQHPVRIPAESDQGLRINRCCFQNGLNLKREGGKKVTLFFTFFWIFYGEKGDGLIK